MKRLVCILLFCTSAWGQSNSLNLQLPSGNTNYQSDKFRAGELDCSNAIGGGTNVEFGVTGIVNNPQEVTQTKDVGVYARIVIPLDAPQERINCNTLYQLELHKKRLEVQKLESELANMRRLQNGKGFEN